MRNRVVSSYSGRRDSWSLRSPVRCRRCHSTYMELIARAEATRSSAWSWAPHSSHQTVMSAADGEVTAYSSLLTLVRCQPAAAASAVAVSPASRRSSRRRSARAWRACWTLDDGDKEDHTSAEGQIKD